MSQQIQAAKKQVLQLTHEANVVRIPVSQACEELMKYCLANQQTDALVTGVSQNENPYKEKSSCLVL
jgi:hypothetical protein